MEKQRSNFFLLNIDWLCKPRPQMFLKKISPLWFSPGWPQICHVEQTDFEPLILFLYTAKRKTWTQLLNTWHCNSSPRFYSSFCPGYTLFSHPSRAQRHLLVRAIRTSWHTTVCTCYDCPSFLRSIDVPLLALTDLLARICALGF